MLKTNKIKVIRVGEKSIWVAPATTRSVVHTEVQKLNSIFRSFKNSWAVKTFFEFIYLELQQNQQQQ